MYTPASVGKIGILSVKKNDSVITRYRPDLGNAEINIPTSDVRSSTTGNFNTTTGGILDSCNVKLEPKQNLHGYTKPWVSGGKNKLPLTLANLKELNSSSTWSGNTYTVRGCEFTVNTDDDNNVVSITVNRISTDSQNPVFYLARTFDITETSILNGCPSGGSSSTYRIRTYEGEYDYGEGVTVTPKTTSSIYIRVEANYNIQNVTFYPMLRLATVSDATFEPYTNICGIEGHSSVEVDVCGINIFSPLSYETVDLTGSGTYRYGHIYSTGTYTIINKSAQQISYRLPKADLSDRGTTVNIEANSSATVTVDATHVLWVFMFTWSSSVAEKICVRKDNDTTFVEFNGTDYTTPLSATVYGGNIDVVSGSGSDEYTSIDMGDMSWTLTSNNYFKSSSIRGDVLPPSTASDTPDAICECFSVTSYNNKTSDCLVIIHSQASSSSYIGQVWAWCSAVSTLEDFETLVTGKKLVYRKATSTTASCTPTQIESLVGENNVTTPLEKQSLNSLTYKEMMSWDDVSDNFKAYMNSVGDNSFTFSQGDSTTSVTIVDRSRAKAECLAYINAQEGTVVPDMAYKAYAVGEHFMHKGKFCTAITAIAQGDMLTLNTNYVEGTIADYITSKDITSDLTWNTSGNTFAHYSASISGNVVTINVRFLATVVSANHVLVSIPDKYMPKSGWYFGNIMKSWYGTPISAVVYKMSTTGQLYLPDVTTFETSVGYVGSFTYVI